MQRAARSAGLVVRGRSTATGTRPRYDPATAGYMGFGDQSGAKQSTAATYLPDAVADGARGVWSAHFVPSGCWSRADGRRALWRRGATAHGQPARGDRARAAGRAWPAARSSRRRCCCAPGSAGRRSGEYLRLHPSPRPVGDYGEDMQAWWGAPQAGWCNEFANTEDGYGFLIEGVQYTTGPRRLGAAVDAAPSSTSR